MSAPQQIETSLYEALQFYPCINFTDEKLTIDMKEEQ
jgi:hypothetical protein